MTVQEVLPQVFLQEHPPTVDHDTLIVILRLDTGMKMYAVKGRRSNPNEKPVHSDGSCTYQIVSDTVSATACIRVDQPLALDQTLIEPRGWIYPCLRIDPHGRMLLAQWVERMNQSEKEH